MMPNSRILRKRKQYQDTENTDNSDDCQASDHTREDHTVTKQPNSSPAPDQPPAPIRSDIGVTTRSHTATSIKKQKLTAFDQSLRPDSSQVDAVVGGDQSQPELDTLRSRIRELEEERNDYHESLHKETEKAMERGRQLLLLQARTATTKQRECSSTTVRHRSSLHHRDERAARIVRFAEATHRNKAPSGHHITSSETTAPRDASMSFGSALERDLHKQVEDLSTRLSEAESEIAQRVSQVLKLFKYKWQDERFAAQSRLLRTEDCKLAQAVEELETSTELRVLREINHGLSEKLRKCCSAEAELQTEARGLRASLEVSARSRDEVAATFRDAIQSHSREKVILEDRMRSLESEIAQARLKIDQLNEEKTSMASRQVLDQNNKNMSRLQASHTRDRQFLVERLESLGCKNKELEAETSSLEETLSELKERFWNLDLKFSESQSQLRTAESKISIFQTTIQNLESGILEVETKHAKDTSALEARIEELSESLNKTTAEVAKRGEELNTLRATSLEKDRALQKARENYEGTAKTLAAKDREASKADAEITRLRRFEYAVTEHDRAVKRLEQGRVEMFRQQKEQLASLTEARTQVLLERQHNRELQGRNQVLERRAQELETTKREDETRFTQFLLSVQVQIGRQIEEPGGQSGTATEIGRPDDAVLKQLEDRLQKKLDRIEYELKWYKDDRVRIYDEYRRLEQWRNEMASNVAARLTMITGPRRSGA